MNENLGTVFRGDLREEDFSQFTISHMDETAMRRVLRIIALRHPRVFKRAVNDEFMLSQVMKAERNG